MKRTVFTVIITLILVIFLASCGWKIEIVDPTKPVESEAEISSEPEKFPEELTPQQERADKYIFEYEFRDSNWMKELSEKGVSVSIEERKYTGDETWEAKLVLKKDENKLSISFNGIYDYTGRVFYGTILFPNSETAVFCGNKKAVFFSTETLEIIDFEPEFTDYGKENTWVIGAGIDDETENKILFVTPLDNFQTEEAVTKILTFDKTGKFISERETTLRGTADSGEKKNPLFYEKTVFFDYKDETFIHTGYEVANLESGMIFKFTGGSISVENGEYGLLIEEIYLDSDKEYMSRRFAQLYKNEKEIGSMVFIEPGFSDSNYMEYPERMRIETDGKTVKFFDDSIKMTLTLDFEKGSHNLVYLPDDSIIDPEQDPITSLDGRYSIYYFGRYGGGDIVNFHVSIRDNETGKHKYLGQDGGMYGSNNGIGFLKNNDVYFYSDYQLKIYDPKTLEVKFDIAENFPLGYDRETESARGLFTFRRDPENFGYIVVYYEYENGIESSRFEINENYYDSWNCNYKIGFLDEEGNLLESYDSGIGIASSPFGLEEANLFYSEDELKIFVSDRRDNPIFTITFNMNTKEFSVA